MNHRILTTAYVGWCLLGIMLVTHALIGESFSLIAWTATFLYLLLTLFVRIGFSGKTPLGRAVNRIFFPLFRNEEINKLDRLQSVNLRHCMEVEIFYSEDVFVTKGYKQWKRWLRRRLFEKQELLDFSDTELFYQR